MKILVLMKRFGTNKDLVMQNFGRQIRLFEPLARENKIDFLCMDYIKFESSKIEKNSITYYIEPFSIAKSGIFLKKLNLLLKNGKYDLIVATTSPILGIIGYYYSKKYRIKMLYDLQDSFDVYDEYKIPFVRLLDKYVTKNCDIAICVSQTLKARIEKFRKKIIYVIQNGVEKDLLGELSKEKCRLKLKLPLKSKIIIYIGYVGKLKGFDILLNAFDKIRKNYPDSYLLISGKIIKDVNINHENVIFEPLPEREHIVIAINAADLAVIPSPRNSFTEYSFPYKLGEYMACSVPIVATDVGDVGLMLRKYNGSLCKPNDAEDLAKKMMSKLGNYKRCNYRKELKELDWRILSRKLNEIIENV